MVFKNASTMWTHQQHDAKLRRQTSGVVPSNELYLQQAALAFDFYSFYDIYSIKASESA